MQLSNRTIKILKNFSEHNEGIFLHPGSLQRMVGRDHGIYAETVLDECIPVEFGISDLKAFVNCFLSVDKPEIEFTPTDAGNHDALIRGSGFEILYRGTPETMIVVPEGAINLQNEIATVSLPKATFKRMLSISAQIQLKDLKVVGKSGRLYVQTEDMNVSDGNRVKMDVTDYDGDDFSIPFGLSMLNFIEDDYILTVYSDGMGAGKFSSSDGRLMYIVPRKVKKR